MTSLPFAHVETAESFTSVGASTPHHTTIRAARQVGQKKALGIAVRNDRPQRRYSGLLSSLRSQAQTGVS